MMPNACVMVTQLNKKYPYLSALLLLTVPAGCAGVPVEPLMPTPVLYSESGIGPLDQLPEERRWNPRRVYYATTRERVGYLRRIDYSNQESANVHVGMAMVGFGGPDMSWADLESVSKVAILDEPVNLTIAGLIEIGQFDPLKSSEEDSPTGGIKWLMSDLNNSITTASDQDILIYVHGAKVNFYNACAFAAQLDHFMRRDMTSLAFSWPTHQNIFSYGFGDDLRRAYYHAQALTKLLKRLAADSVARRVHIVAWSAGGRLVTQALKTLHERHYEESVDLRSQFRIGTVYLAAADVPGSEFLGALPKLNDLSQKIVVTASKRDSALRMSRLAMGGGARIGTVTSGVSARKDAVLRAADRLEVIDVSRGASTRGFDISGHRYGYNHPWASSDLILAIRTDLDAEERALQKGKYPVLWSIPGDYPQRLDEVLRSTSFVPRKVEQSPP
jgi:esterase/lipase superfamily enzyme